MTGREGKWWQKVLVPVSEMGVRMCYHGSALQEVRHLALANFIKEVNQHCIFSIVEKPLFIPIGNSYDLLSLFTHVFYLQKKTNRNQNLNVKTGGER